jgi:hypothetical protein
MVKTIVKFLFVLMLVFVGPQLGFCGYDKDWEKFDGAKDLARWLSRDGLNTSSSQNFSEFFNPDGSQGGDFKLYQQFNFYFTQPQENSWYVNRKDHDRHFNLVGNYRNDSQHGRNRHHNRNDDWPNNWGHMGHRDWDSHKDIKEICGPVTTVPEPISSTLFLLGGGALTLSKMKKKNKVA